MRPLVLALACGSFAAGPAAAQSIEVFAAADCADCSIQVPPLAPIDFYIGVRTGGPVTGLTGLSFKVEGLPAGLFIAILPVHNYVDWCWIDCNPFVDPGLSIGFPECLSGACIPVIHVGGFNPTTISSPVELRVTGRNPTLHPGFDCPLVTLCDPPSYTAVCVQGGRSVINGSADCLLAVGGASWSAVKRLYD